AGVTAAGLLGPATEMLLASPLPAFGAVVGAFVELLLLSWGDGGGGFVIADGTMVGSGGSDVGVEPGVAPAGSVAVGGVAGFGPASPALASDVAGSFAVEFAAS